MKTFALVILIMLTLVSCQKLIDPAENGNAELIGNWTNPQYTDTIVTYSRVSSLVENQYGITFKEDNKLTERQNSGWCGTPPITTADYEGTWTSKDSIVTISVGFWGGTVDLTWRIITVDDHKLVISVVNSDYHLGK